MTARFVVESIDLGPSFAASSCSYAFELLGESSGEGRGLSRRGEVLPLGKRIRSEGDKGVEGRRGHLFRSFPSLVLLFCIGFEFTRRMMDTFENTFLHELHFSTRARAGLLVSRDEPIS